MRRAAQQARRQTTAGIEPAQELADLLALAGSHRAEHVLALLRELLLMPTPDGRPDLLTIEQVANRLQVHPRTIRRAIDAGELKALDLPFRGGLRVTREALEHWFSEHAVVPPPPPPPVSAIAAPRHSGRLELSDV
jgi:excisionase family DNA binding protein